MTFDLLPSSQVNEVDHGCPGHALTRFIGRLLDEGDSNNSVSSTKKKKKFSCNYHKRLNSIGSMLQNSYLQMI